MTKKVIVVLAAMMMVLSVGLTLDAAGQRGMMRHSGFGLRMAENNLFPCFMLLRFKAEIGLTAEQVTKLETMQETFQETRIRRQADIKVQELKLQTYINDQKVDRKKLEKMIRDVANLKTEMQIDRMNHLLDCKSVLTAEQLLKVDQLREENRRNRMDRRGTGRGNRSGRSGRFGCAPGAGAGNG